MRVLVTGGNGQLGSDIRGHFKKALSAPPSLSTLKEHNWFQRGYDIDCDAVTHQDLDISDADAVKAFFDSRAPYDIIINAAAYTNVDGCEKNEALAFKVNALGPMNLAKIAQKQGAKLVQVSTDYVFPGNENSLRHEDDPCRPISAYGRSKYAGEILAQDACDKVFVVRTAWLYALEGKNFVKTMCRLAREHGKVSVVNDQVGCPTFTRDLAEAILCLAATDKYGVYHCVNRGVCSWYDFASLIIKTFGIDAEVEPISTEEYRQRFPLSAARPEYSGLDCRKLEQAADFHLRTWQEAFADYYRHVQVQDGQAHDRQA